MSINMFPTHDDPIQFIDLIKTISFAKGVYIVLNTDGKLQEGDTDHEYQLSPHTITPLEASSTTDLNRYANQAIITIDEDWTEETSTETTTVETGYGISRTIVKIGDQLQTIDTDLGSGNGIEEEWTWDEDGNLTRYDKTETATLEIVTEYTTWSIDSGTGVFTVFQSKIVQKRANPMGDWYYYRKYESTTTTYLDDTAPVAIEEYTFWYFPEEPAWHYKYWVHRVGLPQTPGIIESSRNDYYEYSEADDNWYLQRTVNEGGLTRPEWTKMLQMDKIGMHFCATAEDEPSISFLGVIEQEFAGYGLTDIEDVEDAALNFLAYCQRSDICNVTIPMIPCLVGDVVTWNGEEWTIEQVTHKLDTLSTDLLISKASALEAIKEASFGDPDDIGAAMVALLETKAKRLDNAARATIIAQIDYETYQVHIQGEAESKVRTARIDYRRGETFQPGKEVLLVRPTGKSSGWEIVTRRNDPVTILSTVTAPAPPAPALEFYLGRTIYTPESDVLMLHLGDGYKFEVKWGYEGDTIRKYTKQDGEWKADDSDYENYVWQDGHGLVLKELGYPPLSPASYPEQTMSGSIRLMSAAGVWTDWHDFTYKMIAPCITDFFWEEGTPEEGESTADVPSAYIKPVTFSINCDFRSLLANVYLEWTDDTDPDRGWGRAPIGTVTHFRAVDTSTPVAVTGYYQWQFSETGAVDTWHSTPTTADHFSRVGNGTDWGDALRGTYEFKDRIQAHLGMGYPYVIDWFSADAQAQKSGEYLDYILEEEMRLSFDNGVEVYVPPYPGETVNYKPRISMDFVYGWEDPNE